MDVFVGFPIELLLFSVYAYVIHITTKLGKSLCLRIVPFHYPLSLSFLLAGFSLSAGARACDATQMSFFREIGLRRLASLPVCFDLIRSICTIPKRNFPGLGLGERERNSSTYAYGPWMGEAFGAQLCFWIQIFADEGLHLLNLTT